MAIPVAVQLRPSNHWHFSLIFMSHSSISSLKWWYLFISNSWPSSGHVLSMNALFLIHLKHVLWWHPERQMPSRSRWQTQYLAPKGIDNPLAFVAISIKSKPIITSLKSFWSNRFIEIDFLIKNNVTSNSIILKHS